MIGVWLTPPTRQALMTTATREDLHVLDIAPPAWCWTRLTCSSEATLSFSTMRGRFTVDVRYTLGQAQLAIAMPSLEAVGWQAAGHAATLKITRTTADQLRWSVRVGGHAHRAGQHLLSTSGGRRPDDRSRPAWLALTSLQVRGYYETIALDGLPPNDPMLTADT